MAHKLSTDALERVMRQPSHIRNICILAHVDHGKTTLSDCLISSNAIISQKLAGKVRYMDSTEEEQARGITMKSSAIALLHYDEAFRELRAAFASPKSAETAGAPTAKQVPYLVNLIDSPGHVDFSMDVATAARLCDGALVVVDAVEGVCIQTHAVLKVAWAEGVRPTLIINKLDRLITEVKMSPLEAYNHINKILEQANVIMSELYTADLMSKLGQTAATATNEEKLGQTAGTVTNKDDGAVSATKQSSETTAEDASETHGTPKAAYQFDAWGVDIDEATEAQLFFDPARGNVVFASAFDGWAFSVDEFASLHYEKLELPRAQLRKHLWGDYYYNPKTKKISTGDAAAAANKGKPLAVSLMLERLWAVYDAVIENPDETRLNKIIGILGLTIPPKELAVKDNAQKLQAVMRAWLPLHSAVLGMVVRKLPSPLEAQKKRVETLWPGVFPTDIEAAPITPDMPLHARLARVRKAIQECSPSEDADCVVYVSKMIAVPKVSVPPFEGPETCQTLPPSAFYGLRAASNDAPLTSDAVDLRPVNVKLGRAANSAAAEDLSDVETFVAFARVFSGVLRPDKPMFVLGPRYDPADPTADNSDHISVTDTPLPLYLLMGRGMNKISAGFAGNVLGIGKLGSHVLKTATLSTTPTCASLAPMTFQTTPLVKVAIEPKNPRDLNTLERGLALLNQADPCVETHVTDTGEMQLSALGELHLDRCVKDLLTRFAKVEINVSPPIMNFMETIIASALPQPALAVSDVSASDAGLAGVTSPTAPAGSVASIAAFPKTCALPTSGVTFHVPTATTFGFTADKQVLVRIRAAPAPPDAATFVMAHANQFKTLNKGANETHTQIYEQLKAIFSAASDTWAKHFERILCLGPKYTGPNFLVDNTAGVFDMEGNAIASPSPMPSLWSNAGLTSTSSSGGSSACPQSLRSSLVQSLRSSLVQGFQLATAGGPLCAEPMWGVVFIVEEIRVAAIEGEGGAVQMPVVPAGQVITTVRDACRVAFQAGTPRLVEALFKCELQCSGGRGGGTSGEQLGKLYAVLYRRRARILSEDMFEGTQTFLITSLLPVVESYGFADDLRKKTSGAATSPQLLFSHWEVLEQDPLFQPTTAEEKEEFGDTVHEGQLKNIARRFMDAVRERKGMPTEKQLVVHAEKQSNLSRKK